MVAMVIEGLIIISALISAGIMTKQKPTKSQKVLSKTVVIGIAVFIGFSIAQICQLLGIIKYAPTYTPIEVLFTVMFYLLDFCF